MIIENILLASFLSFSPLPDGHIPFEKEKAPIFNVNEYAILEDRIKLKDSSSYTLLSKKDNYLKR